VLAAVVLLVGALAGGGLVRDHLQQADAQATQTASARSGNPASPTAGQATTATGGAAAVILTATAAAFIPTATATAGLTTDVTSPPPAPAAADQVAFADAAPLCHGSNPIYPPWTVASNTTKAPCPPGGGTEIKAQASGSLACIEQHSGEIPTDAYISVLASDTGSGAADDAVLGFRQGQVSTATSKSAGTPGVLTYAGVGFYYKVARADTSYVLYQFDSATHQTTLSSDPLSATPAKDFALGVLVQGNQITLYVNGELVAGPFSDATHPTGWVALCTDGDVIFRDFQVYSLRA
jgi:hypothetical protein